MKNILCFGDCNTFGKNAEGNRLPRQIRWTGKAQQLLGEDFYLIEEGLEGRTTIWDDPLLPQRCGLSTLPISLLTHKPLDMVILSLGTNDIKRYFRVSPEEIANGMEQLVQKIQTSQGISNGKSVPRILILAPVPLGEKVSRSKSLEYDETSRLKSMELGSLYRHVAEIRNCGFLDTASFANVGADHLHLDEAGHLRTAELVTEKVREMLA